VNMDTVSQPVSLRMFTGGQRHEQALNATLAYDRKEPYEARLLFPLGLEHLDLVLARDLLASGLTGPATYGGIRVWPNHDHYWVACIGWTTPAGHAPVEARAVAIAHFLNLTYYLVPQGSEPPRADIDTVIAAILAEGGPR
jgi:Streptomyces sporulation and cell division protein, SsgA